MSSILDKPAVRQAALAITVEQYHRLGETGIIGENTELIRGVIVQKMVKSPLHSWLVQHLAQCLRDCLRQRFHVRQEQPLTFGDSEPEPDIAVVTGSASDYRNAHPKTAQLVMEVSIASVELDREKAQLYASAGVAEYWLILPDQRAVEVYTGPSSSGYSENRRYRADDAISSQSFPELTLALSQLFS